VRLTRGRLWLIAGLVLGLLRAAGAMGKGGQFFEAVGDFFQLWLVVSTFLLVFWLWRKLTYRIWVRLFFSYLLIGVMPFLVLAMLGSLALYMLMGQYTSVRWGDRIQLTQDRMSRRCLRALEVGARDGTEKMLEWLKDLEKHPPEPLGEVLWLVQDGENVVRSDGAGELFLPPWLHDGPPVRLLVFRSRNPYLVVMAKEGARGVLLGVRLDDDFAKHLNHEGWFDVYFYVSEAGLVHQSPTLTVRTEGGRGPHVMVQDQVVPVEEVWGSWPVSESSRWVDRPLVIWFRLAGRVVDMETGEPLKKPELVTLLRTSPAAVWRDFVRSPYALGEKIRQILLSSTFVLGSLYLAVVGIAALMILAITRSVSRLSRGAREIARGNLAHRVPVKRRDQLGDLALSFNSMAESVQRMLEEVREKERLAHELELARQIQENLLPGRWLKLGKLEVRASFRPAAEVGGDYFDILVPEDGKVIAAVGDVAGHGLATGLFMASIKSAVAAFAGEGYRGAQLLERLQGLMLQGNRHSKQPMVTLLVAEIDASAWTVRLASAGHPPAYLVRPDGSVEEIMLGSMPLGFPRCRPREGSVSFEPGSCLVLYSDGLVEALNDSDEPLGYPALRQILEGGSSFPGAVLERIEGALQRHVGNRSLEDDVTIVVVGAPEDTPDRDT